MPDAHASTHLLPPTTTVAAEVDGFTVSAATAHGRQTIVEDVSFTLRRGTVTGLAGESGSGKTVTALGMMGLLDKPALKVESGRILVGDQNLLTMSERQLRTYRGARISMVFQEPLSSLDPAFPVGTLIGEVLRAHLVLTRRQARRQAIELLDKVGIRSPEKRVDSYPFELSGGMLQRVLIAMAIAGEPTVLIADEPTTALDVTVQAQILRLLRSLADEGMAVLLVTHDLGVLAEHADDLVVMYAGQVVEGGPTADVLAAPRHPYASGLLNAIPSAFERLDPLPTIPGSVPLPHQMPSGCRFAPRCRFVEEACALPLDLKTTQGGRRDRCRRSDELRLEGVR